jgi:hypothetical protein
MAFPSAVVTEFKYHCNSSSIEDETLNMAAQSKSAGLTSVKNPYPRKPIQAKLTITAAARPATGQARLKTEIDSATLGSGGVATTCPFSIFTVGPVGALGESVPYGTLRLRASANLYRKAHPCGPVGASKRAAMISPPLSQSSDFPVWNRATVGACVPLVGRRLLKETMRRGSFCAPHTRAPCLTAN